MDNRQALDLIATAARNSMPIAQLTAYNEAVEKLVALITRSENLDVPCPTECKSAE